MIYNTRIFEEIESHIKQDHNVTLCTYGHDNGNLVNIAIECRTCHVVLHDIEKEPVCNTDE